jgi:hypothetical protein
MAGRQPSHRAGRVGRLFQADRNGEHAASLGGLVERYPVELTVKPVRSGRF